MNNMQRLASLVAVGLPLICSACRTAPESDSNAPLGMHQNMVSFDQCDIDIRPKNRMANPDRQLHVEYDVDKVAPKGMTLTLETTAAGFGLYDQENVKLTGLSKGVKYNLSIVWGDVAKADTFEVTVAGTSYTLHSFGGFDGTEPDFSPSFERDQDGEFVRIRCRFRGRSTFLIVK